MTLRSLIIRSIHMCYIHLQWVVAISYFPNISYFIKDLVLGKQIKTHVHNLRPFLFSPDQVNPVEVAQQNEQEFMVRDIIAHRGDHHKRSSMEFLVRPAMTRVPTVGNLTKPWCMSTSSTITYESTRCDPGSPENTSSYGESFQDFPRLFQARLVFPLGF